MAKATTKITTKEQTVAVAATTIPAEKMMSKALEKAINLAKEFEHVSGIHLTNVTKIGDVHEAFRKYFAEADDSVRETWVEKYGKYYPKKKRNAVIPEGTVGKIVGFVPTRAKHAIIHFENLGYASFIPVTQLNRRLPKNFNQMKPENQEKFVNSPLSIGEEVVSMAKSQTIWWNENGEPVYEGCNAVNGQKATAILKDLLSGKSYEEAIKPFLSNVTPIEEKEVATA